MSQIIGIDLGTTTSELAYIDSSGVPRILRDRAGGDITPSVVAFEDGDLFVGEVAKKIGEEGLPVFKAFKRNMNDPDEPVSTEPPSEYEKTPVELSSLILKYLADHAQEQLGEFTLTTIGIPANVHNIARAATMRAGREAGLTVGQPLNEPTAAAIYYATNTDVAPGRYYVYDLGGGTFDLSYVEIKRSPKGGVIVDVIDHKGKPRLGGEKFDEVLKGLVEEMYLAKTGEELNYDENDKLKSEYEGIKKKLTDRPSSVVNVHGTTRATRADIIVTRADFEERISPLIDDSLMLCRLLLAEHPDFEDVLLVGGSTKVPKVQESVEEIFGKKPRTVGNPDEVVALGAAVYTGQYLAQANPELLNAFQLEKLKSVEVNEITNHYYGLIITENHGTPDEHDINSTIIERRGQVPCSRTEKYAITNDGQTSVRLRITQSDVKETDPVRTDIVWEGRLPIDSDVSKKDDSIEVTYSYTKGEMMGCIFVYEKTGQRLEIDLDEELRGTPSDEDVITE